MGGYFSIDFSVSDLKMNSEYSPETPKKIAPVFPNFVQSQDILTDTSCDEGFVGSNLATPESPIIANFRSKFQSPSKFSPDKQILIESPCRLGKKTLRKNLTRQLSPKKNLQTGIDIIKKL